MKSNLILIASVYAGVAFAGGSTGTGTPPAREQLEEMIMSAEIGQGGLFDSGLGDVGLLTNRELQPQMTLTKNRLLKGDIEISEPDFDLLRDRTSTIDSIGALGESRSYRISAGDQTDSLTITDRRVAARAAVAQ